MASLSIVHLFPFSVSVYSPPPSQSIVHVPFGTIKTVVWEQCWQHHHGSCRDEIIGTLWCGLLQIVVRHRDGRENRDFLWFQCSRVLASNASVGEVWGGKCCKNRGFGRCGVPVRLCGRRGGNMWSVNFGFFFDKKMAFMQNLQGGEHFSLRFPVKSEMPWNFQVHPRGVGSVNFRKVVASRPF